MPQIVIYRPEVWYAPVYIEADDEDDALKQVLDGGGSDYTAHYHTTLDPSDVAPWYAIDSQKANEPINYLRKINIDEVKTLSTKTFKGEED